MWLRKVRLVGIHGHQQIEQTLGEGLNILYGKNGSGKTTFLHVIANLLDRDFERFFYIRFSHIEAHFYDNSWVRVVQKVKDDDVEIEVFINGRSLGAMRRGQEIPEDISSAVLGKDSRGRPIYVPAFRSILEAAPARRMYFSGDKEDDEKELRKIAKREADLESALAPSSERYRRSYRFGRDRSIGVARKTVLCRRWFGEFVPIISYPSLANIEDELRAELEAAYLEIHYTDQRILSSVFTDVMKSLLDSKRQAETAEPDKTSDILTRVEKNLAILSPVEPKSSEIYSLLLNLIEKMRADPATLEASQFNRILEIYDRALDERAKVQGQAYKRIKVFQASVNQFLEGKRLEFGEYRMMGPREFGPFIGLGKNRRAKLAILSSGERHVLSLLFSATHMASASGVLLIDEPELSLHVDWQRIILSELMQQVGSRQIVVCTHSPEIAADHREHLRRLAPGSWQVTALDVSDTSDLDPYKEQ